jgi:hypothetical protein
MTSVRVIKHEAIAQTGSYEVKFTDGRPSVYHYFDDDPAVDHGEDDQRPGPRAGQSGG